MNYSLSMWILQIMRTYFNFTYVPFQGWIYTKYTGQFLPQGPLSLCERQAQTDAGNSPQHHRQPLQLRVFGEISLLHGHFAPSHIYQNYQT